MVNDELFEFTVYLMLNFEIFEIENGKLTVVVYISGRQELLLGRHLPPHVGLGCGLICSKVNDHHDPLEPILGRIIFVYPACRRFVSPRMTKIGFSSGSDKLLSKSEDLLCDKEYRC